MRPPVARSLRRTHDAALAQCDAEQTLQERVSDCRQHDQEAHCPDVRDGQ